MFPKHYKAEKQKNPTNKKVEEKRNKEKETTKNLSFSN
jgi:hypothetical protein